MLSNGLRMSAAALFLTIGAMAAEAQQPVPARPANPPVNPPPTATPNPNPPASPGSATPTTVYRAKQVLGSKIFIQGNVVIGTVEDLVFDDAGNLEYMIVANDGKLVTVPWEAAKFNFENHTAVVNLTAEQYKTIPTYTTTTYPEFYSPTYRTQVYRFYNLNPRELRRLERRGVAP